MSNIVELLIKEIQEREKVGLKKYKTTMDRTDLSEDDWLQHLYEELLDASLYIKKIIELRKLNNFQFPNQLDDI